MSIAAAAALPIVTNAQPREAADVKASRKDVIALATQLSVMLDAGVMLSEALEVAAEHCDRPALKKLIDDVRARVASGHELSGALARHPRSFPRLFVALVRAAEKSGKLGTMIARATAYLRDEQEVRRKVKGALTYPAIMFGFAALTTVGLLAFVLPRFTALYGGKNVQLPLPTRVLMGASDVLLTQWPALLLGAGFALAAVWTALGTPAGQAARDRLVLALPLFGDLARRVQLSRALRTVGTMSASGVNLVECVETARQLATNVVYRDLWTRVLDDLQRGRQLSDPLAACPDLVPPTTARMLRSGERAGKLGPVMDQVAGFAEQELKEKIAELTRYVEPAMIVVMGGLIGGVTMALLLPVFNISKVVAG